MPAENANPNNTSENLQHSFSNHWLPSSKVLVNHHIVSWMAIALRGLRVGVFQDWHVRTRVFPDAIAIAPSRWPATSIVERSRRGRVHRKQREAAAHRLKR